MKREKKMRTDIVKMVDDLYGEGLTLKRAFVILYLDEKEVKEKLKLSDEEYRKELKNSIFSNPYQKWFSKCIVLLQSILPSRLDEFKELYQPTKVRKYLDVSNYTVSDAIKGLVVHFSVSPKDALPPLSMQIDIIGSLKAVIEGRLSEITNLLEYELFEKEIDAAEHLYKKGFLRAAGALCGVLLEKYLKDYAQQSGISIKKNATLNEITQTLYENNVIEITQYKKLQYLCDVRNKCDHDKDAEPTKIEIEDLISGTKNMVSSL